MKKNLLTFFITALELLSFGQIPYQVKDIYPGTGKSGVYRYGGDGLQSSDSPLLRRLKDFQKPKPFFEPNQ